MTIYFPHWWSRDDVLWCMANRWKSLNWRWGGHWRGSGAPFNFEVEVEL